MHPTKEIRNTERKHISPITIPLPNPHHSSIPQNNIFTIPHVRPSPKRKPFPRISVAWKLPNALWSSLTTLISLFLSPPLVPLISRISNENDPIGKKLIPPTSRIVFFDDVWRGNISGKEMGMRFGSMHFWHASRRGSLPLAQTEGVECRTHVGKSDNE